MFSKILFASCLALLLLSSLTSSPPYIRVPTKEKTIYDICFTKNGTTLLVADGNCIRWFSMNGLRLLGESIKGHHKTLLSIDLSPDSSLMVSAGRDSIITLWDVKRNLVVKQLSYHNGIVTSVKLSPDHKYLLSGGTDDHAFVYDVQADKIRLTLRDHDHDVTSVAFHPDGKRFATAGADGKINIYDLSTNKLVKSYRGLGFIGRIDFSNDGTKLLSCGDKSIVTWSIENDGSINEPFFHDINSGWLMSAKFNEDNHSIVSAGVQGKVHINTKYATYESRLRAPVTDVEFKHAASELETVAVSTVGKGTLIIDVKKMKVR
jgi:WD40 repeat protein